MGCFPYGLLLPGAIGTFVQFEFNMGKYDSEKDKHMNLIAYIGTLDE